jgi:hypothetical protein
VLFRRGRAYGVLSRKYRLTAKSPVIARCHPDLDHARAMDTYDTLNAIWLESWFGGRPIGTLALEQIYGAVLSRLR